MTRSCYFWFIWSRDQFLIILYNFSCVVARSVCFNSTCVKNLESPFYMYLEIKIYQIKYVLLVFVSFAEHHTLLSKVYAGFSTKKIFHTLICFHCAVSLVLSPDCCEVLSPLFLPSMTTRSSIVATFVLGWSWRISTPWNRRHRKWHSG